MLRALIAILVVAAAGCAGEPAAPHAKPHAPVGLQTVAADLGGGLYEVLVEGTAGGPMTLELFLPDGVERVAGAARVSGPGPRQTLVARLRGPAGARVGAGARVDAGGRVTTFLLGTPPAARWGGERVVVSPFGPVAEATP